jgi:flagellar hook-associated protein 1 FlgK
VRAAVGEINTLVGQIASLNRSLGATDPASGEAQHLRDEITRHIDELSALVDIDVVETSDGLYDVTFGSGRPLVIADNAYTIGITNRAVTGVADLTVNGVVVTGEVTAGRLGGLIAARDVNIPAYVSALDTLAYAVATGVNTAHTAGYDITGTAGVNFFAPPAAVTGAAGNIAMNAALTAANGGQLVAASKDPLSSGDNQNARILAALRTAKLMSGGQATFADSWSELVYAAGRDVSVALSEQKVRGEIVRQVSNLRDSTSGVSLDEEAADMMRFQRAYEANARFFSTIDDLLGTLMNMVN